MNMETRKKHVLDKVSEQTTNKDRCHFQQFFRGQIPIRLQYISSFISSTVCRDISEIDGLFSVYVLVINPAFVKVKYEIWQTKYARIYIFTLGVHKVFTDPFET
jgi:hypothetical protein